MDYEMQSVASHGLGSASDGEEEVLFCTFELKLFYERMHIKREQRLKLNISSV